MSTAAFALKRTQQCKLCPWKVTTNPREIPRGYDPEKHRKLAGTIAQGSAVEQMSSNAPVRAMACHEEHDVYCIGWLMHQLGPGNNLRLRLLMRNCTNLDEVQLDGEQHETFEDTLPD